MTVLFYIGLAGSGWVLDMILFWLLVSAGVEPGWANFGSATVAAMTVYVLAQRLLFAQAAGSRGGFLVYLAYTEANIVLWALVIQVLSAFLWHNGLLGAQTEAALMAKILVTPLSLACNFLVTRLIARWQFDER